MKKAEIVIVGGGPAGITAAVTARRHYPDKKVLLIRNAEKSIVPCGIPYMFGTLKDPTQNINPDSMLLSRGIDLIIDQVNSVDRKAKKVFLEKGEEITYEKLILATGSIPKPPEIPGINLDNVYLVKKEWKYLLNLRRAIETSEKIVIIGGGFVGVEIAEEIKIHHRKDVSIVEVLPYPLYNSFDETFCFEAAQELEAMGIKFYTDVKVERIIGTNGKVKEVELSDGTVLPADLVIVSIGVAPLVDLAKSIGLEIGPLGGILADRTMTTSDPDIFVCGDCAEKFSFFNGRPVPVKLASVAATEARIAGANLYSKRRAILGTIGVFSTKIGKKVFAVAGLTERHAEEEGFEVIVGETSAPNRHPSVLPGVQDVHVILIFDKHTETLLGGEVSGGESVAELINLISACLLHRMTATNMAAFQMGTHPMLTSSPGGYPLVVAAELAVVQKYS
ncbi:FAD-dependent pyridine nucleotide-disulfide oxidoreductase [Thermodesulfatator indicus DSM 15286]|uniref:FAD-dependent pyridine nucleotide-disulfide oxidoreductase n=1 Tax=Thermodesulfatator indicus (strain DSM 15286 / JCM 11887 / CIR29812) TaxID=667014 RepID=F8ADP5_THEID|nr:FAD-dependent oxidoreductase [Thermodesulfatator indicus]AEH46003.1 FAD-dependent pyridine nucleotide-disulfide oxidoreductase [Thermodesulfatator indicus DSM 15286]